MPHKNSAASHMISRKKVILLLVALLALYVLIPRLSSFRHSLETIRDAYLPFVGIALLFWLASFGFAALVYKLISPKILAYRPTLLVQIASGFTSRLAPAGAGTIALNSRYLVKRGNSALTAGAMVAANNLVGIVGNVVLLLVALALSVSPATDLLKIHVQTNYGYLLGVLLVLVIAIAVSLGLHNDFALRLKKTVRLMLKTIKKNPARLSGALMASMAITASYAFALAFLELAFNVHVSVAQTLFVMAFGVITSTVTPTPGGIGGAEAGLTAAFIAVGVSSQQALAVALAYRFLIYWLPILPGLIAFQIALHRRYI